MHSRYHQLLEVCEMALPSLKSRTLFLKSILSLGILFHLAVIISLPNEASYFNVRFRDTLYPYANLLALNSLWQFFSPDPGPPMFLKYELKKDGESLATGTYPALHPTFWERTSYARRVTSLRFFARQPDALTKVLAPYLCRQNPTATSIDFVLISMKVPTLEEVQMGHELNSLEGEVKQHQDIILCAPPPEDDS